MYNIYYIYNKLTKPKQRCFGFSIGLCCPQEVAQSTKIMPNEAEVTSSNSLSSLVRTCQKKKKYIYIYV
jgi:hypothetical protein